ncbi:carbohydrate-binding protein [Clostridium beijerinckii]|uniref:Chitodextrinase n=1 Tax=Clostridium beijerinckii TaxID=1520 RepID=A0AAE5EXL4_CLOBE|nr:carbohydrate-binding protein [Clostridium beijerinckii]NSB14544.1 chitodextrinase [Clostridium beijerinckii]OOM27630.1 chitinase A precursor [Clostridium beijerinckii]
MKYMKLKKLFAFAVVLSFALPQMSMLAKAATTKASTVIVSASVAYANWDANKAYVSGDTVNYEGKNYKAKWWTQGDKPGSADVWELIGTAPSNPSNNTYAAWDSSKAYVSGDIVSYQNSNYKAKWWTQGEKPGSTDVWELIGAGPTNPTNPTNPTTPTNPSVSKPAEAPNDIWEYALNADNKFGKNGDFALLICAVIKKECNYGAGLGGSPSSGDGLMQVEPNTRNAYSSEFQSTYGHAYNHSNLQDQVYMGSMIINDNIKQFGNIYNGLLHYNGGPNWYPGATDSYGRPILADQYANAVYATYKSYGGKN